MLERLDQVTKRAEKDSASQSLNELAFTASALRQLQTRMGAGPAAFGRRSESECAFERQAGTALSKIKGVPICRKQGLRAGELPVPHSLEMSDEDAGLNSAPSAFVCVPPAAIAGPPSRGCWSFSVGEMA
jgi:hypothetical protein